MQIYGFESNEAIRKELGNRIQALRVDMAMTQKDLAVRSGVSASTMERIENGENVKLDNILNVFRMMDILSNLNVVVPEVRTSARDMYELGKRRQRASAKQRLREKRTAWTWGDEG